jgi:hypothetical protein
MRRRVFLGAVAVAVMALALVVIGARPGSASWSGTNCYEDNHTEDGLKRADARAYADVAQYEGYEWGGGCWNNNNRDDTPGQPDSGGEGPDCSGLVFKSWELRWTKGLEGFRWYSRLENRHGPYVTSDYRYPIKDYPFFQTSKDRSNLLYMDAFASPDHMGLLYTESNPSSGTDYVLEAFNDASGVDVNIEAYRFDPSYVGSRRGQWTPDCSPKCGPVPGPLVVS